MKEKTDEQPDFFQLLRQQPIHNQYMRFYLQQDIFSCHPIYIKNQNDIFEQHKHKLKISLPLNRLISDSVSEIMAINNFVYNNSRIMISLLESGREMVIAKSGNKHFRWRDFIFRKEFVMIRKAYESLNIEDQLAIEFSVCAVSNLIMKLGINISKLTCIVTQRRYTTNFLSLPLLSILFLQNLMYIKFQNKQIDQNDQQAKSQFIRQLPKITYIKISEFINKAELLAMEIGEEVYFTSQTLKKVKNLQYFQFYERQQYQGTKGYEHVTKYEYIKSVNMKQSFGMESPYGFQLLFLFRTIYFNVIRDFNPDVISFVEDYDSKKRIIQPEIRALLINELMENVTGKVLVLREVGFVPEFEHINSMNYLQDWNHHSKNVHMENETDRFSQTNSTFSQLSYQANENKTEQKSFLTSKQVYQNIMFRVQTLPQMTRELQLKLDKEFSLRASNCEQQLTEMSRILREDLNYIALALIQRSSFQEISTKSHSYIYQEQFLSNLLQCLTNDYINPAKEDKRQQLCDKLEVSRSLVCEMMENMKLQKKVLFQDYFDSIIDLRLRKRYFLDVIGSDNLIVERIRYYEEDYLHVYYGEQEELLVFLFRGNLLTLLKLYRFYNPIMNQQFYYWEPILYEQNLPAATVRFNPTYLITDQFVYQAFGMSKEKNVQYQQHQEHSQFSQNKIYRFNYRNFILENRSCRNKVTIKSASQMNTMKSIMDEQFKDSLSMEVEVFHHDQSYIKVEEISSCFLKHPGSNNEVQVGLITKTYGWAMYDYLSKCAIFMGGYSPNNENSLNRYLHVVSQTQNKTRQTGKTSNQLFKGAKYFKAKIPLYPFIYGIPFIIDNRCYILSTNGYFQCFTNYNKLFLTQFKLSYQPGDMKYGILSQQKLFVNYKDDDQRLKIITAKQLIVHYIVNSYRLKNSFRNCCELRTLEEGSLMLELRDDEYIDQKRTVSLTITTDRVEQNGFESICLFFSPLEL